MVYLVPELDKIIKSGQNIILHLNLFGMPLECEVRIAWKKDYDGIPFAGFEFINISQEKQEILVEASRKISENDI